MNLLRELRPTLLDRYVLREIVPPTFLGLLLFTFILLLDQISNLMRILISRGADFHTVLRAFLYLLPSIFAVTIPMAFLLGILLAFGRLASDSEIVALRASGISPGRLLRPVLAAAAVATFVTFYVVGVALPASNQNYREIIFALVVSKAKSAVKPRVFTDEDLVPGMILYVSDIPAQTGDWNDIFIHDLRVPSHPKVILARSGRLVIDRDRKRVELDLEHGVIHSMEPATPQTYERQVFRRGSFPLPFEHFFPQTPLIKGDREMDFSELDKAYRQCRADNKTDADCWKFLVEIHKKFAIPTACIVFGLLGLGLSLGSKKEARSAAFALSIAVIFVYYVFIRMGEQAGDNGRLHPLIGMWSANVVLGAVALVLLWLNYREAAFDPLDPSHYTALIPTVKPESALWKRLGLGVSTSERHAPPVVVLRIPRVSLPLPGLLDRYVGRRFVQNFVLVMTSFWALFVLMSFIDLYDDWQQNKFAGSVFFSYYFYFSPQIIHLVAPVGVLVAVLITLGLLSRNNELTAMKAAGISVYRASLPVILLGFLASAMEFGASEYLLPTMNRHAQEHFNVIKGRPPQSTSAFEKRWILGSDNRFYNYDYMEGAPRAKDGAPAPAAGAAPTLYGLSVYDVDAKSWDLKERLYAARARWNGMQYDMERGWRRTFAPGAKAGFEAFPTMRTREIEEPAYFHEEHTESDKLGFLDLRKRITSLEARGLDVTPLRVQLHRKIAYPMVSLVMTFIGIPFSFVVARRGALYGVAASIVLAIVYWATLSIFEAFGNNARVPEMLAAWAPNLMFGAAGLYLVLTLDT